MSRPRFLADHDLNEHIVVGLKRREPSAEFLRARDLHLETKPDDDVLAFAADHGFLVVSHDVNTMTAAAFGRIANNKPLSGLFMVPQAASIRQVVEDLALIWTSSEAEEWAGRVCFLPID